MFRLTVILAVLASASAQTCPTAAASFQVFGSPDVLPVAQAWEKAYKSKCPTQKITIPAAAKTSAAAAALCGGTTDIALMARDFTATEATSTGANKHKCVTGALSAINCVVALDGVVVVTRKGGAAATCITTNGGLTIANLACIFGASGTCAKWSDVNPKCGTGAITTAGSNAGTATSDFFAKGSGFATGEAFKATYKADGLDPAKTVATVLSDVNAIGFLAYGPFSKASSTLVVASINKVTPSPATIASGAYTPFSRSLYMAAVDDAKKLPYLKVYIGFGLSSDPLTVGAGQVAATAAQKAACKAALAY